MATTKLCRWCKQINFEAILTPRTWDEDTGRLVAPLRPEYSGNGRSPSLEWTQFGKTKRTGPPDDYLPQIRTARYDELSDSEIDLDPPQAQVQPDFGSQARPLPQNNLSGDGRGKSDGIEGSDPQDNRGCQLNNFDNVGSGSEGESSDDESVSTWSNHSHYTEIQRIDLEKQAQGNWDYRHGHLYYLGSIWDVRSRRQECDLCRRLWRATRAHAAVKGEYLTKSRCILKLLNLDARRSEQADKPVYVLNMLYMFGYKLGDPRRGGWDVKFSMVIQGQHRDVCELHEQISRDQIIPFQDRLFGEARPRADVCDFSLFRDWLKTCETKHNHPSLDLPGNMTIRLIDVQRKCLVEWQGPTSEAPRYVALSYIWGKEKQAVMLTKDRLSEFEKPGFFDQKLDRTIQDAIEVVARIGETFLWVDALCILQDDPEDKTIQIPQMHRIYGKAVLVIVAAHGDSADAGLPGVGPRSRKLPSVLLDLPGIRLIRRSPVRIHTAEDDLDICFTENYLLGSTYTTRAWTFQEGYLATRVLIFTIKQVYFECPRCTWCEETHWESDTMDFTGWRGILDPTPIDAWIDRLNRRAYDYTYGDEEKPEPPRNSYATVIENYTERNLTHDTDILDACTGVLSRLRETEQTDFFFGLRTRLFGNDLLFNYNGNAARRFPDQDTFGATTSAKFPTWSWTAWEGRIEIANVARNTSWDPVENLGPCDGVKCYRMRVDQRGNKSLEVINENGGWRFKEDYVRRGEGIFDPTDNPGDFEPDAHFHDESDSTEATITTADSFKVDAAAIPSYPQDLTLSSLSHHPAYTRVLPDFHVVFATFSCLVVLRTQGYKEERNKDIPALFYPSWGPRQVYACRRKKTLDPEPEATSQSSPSASLERKSILRPLPRSLERGPYLGSLPSSRDYGELLDIPDGVYRLLFMNNNQLPMWGHLLCKPNSSSALEDGSNWDGEILERVSCVTGPANILERAQQKKYGVEWGIHVLG